MKLFAEKKLLEMLLLSYIPLKYIKDAQCNPIINLKIIIKL